MIDLVLDVVFALRGGLPPGVAALFRFESFATSLFFRFLPSFFFCPLGGTKRRRFNRKSPLGKVFADASVEALPLRQLRNTNKKKQ